MRLSSVLSVLALAVAVPAAPTPSDQGQALSVVDAKDIEAVVNNLPASEQDIETRHIEARWENSYAWPESSVAGGSIDYQFRATNLGNNKFKIEFFNSGPGNGYSYKYIFTSGGASVTKVIPPRGSSVSFEVQKSGESFQVSINPA